MSQEDLFEKPVAVSGVVSVLVPYPVDKAYDYAVPVGMHVAPGDYVCVPLGSREITGVVWGKAAGDVPQKKLKAIVSRYDLEPMAAAQRGFIDWVAGYTVSMKGSVLKMALSVPAGLTPPKAGIGYRVIAPSPDLTGVRPPSPHGGEGQRGEAEQGEGGKPYAPKVTAELIKRSRNLRQNQTEVEKKLWACLRNRQIANCKFRRQHPVGSYITDFACSEHKLIIELDGGQHAEQAEYDEKRTAYLEEQGYHVVRYWNHEVVENIGGVLEDISMHLTPSILLPKGEREVLTPQRKAVMDVMASGQVMIASDIAAAAGCSAGVVKGMVKAGLLEEVGMISPAPCINPDYAYGRADLSEQQRAAADALCADEGFAVSLLDGVTGAGKTEVYFEAVAKTLEREKQALILLPEIALSNAFLSRFQDRFGCAPALWHSGLTPAQRRKTWRGVAQGETRVVVGARSALFLPYPELGLIVVDEEHDPAYKQEDGVIYHARDMAIVRAKMGGFPVCLVSATPSLETMVNVWDGKYRHLELPSRYGGAQLPEVSVIDMRSDKPESGCFLSSGLVEVMKETLARGEQVLLFLNRRGYAPLTLCRTCGHRMECPRCTAWLVEHKRSGRLHCHHCGFHAPVPKVCPECNDEDSFAVCGPGVERVMEEAKALFPDARMQMIASDLVESPQELKGMLSQVSEGGVDIIVGTQIIAKGHHFPNLTLVGVVDADLGLSGGELRAAERTYQMLHQVAGRAGRAEKKGRVVLQSYMPEHRIIQAMVCGSPSPDITCVRSPSPPRGEGQRGEAEQGEGARDAFLRVESEEREAAGMPPYSRLVGIIIAGRDEGQVVEVAKALGRSAPQGEKIATLGPAAAPMARLRGRYRYRLLVRSDKDVNVQKTVEAWVAGVKVPSTVRIYIDVDPQSFI